MKPPKAARRNVVKERMSRAERAAQELIVQKRQQELDRAERRKKKLEREELQRVKREAKHEANTAKDAMLEINAVKVVQKTMQTRYLRAKLLARNVASRVESTVKAYLAENKDRPTEIGWLEQLSGHLSELDLNFKNKKTKEAAEPKKVIASSVEEVSDDSVGDESVTDLASEEDMTDAPTRRGRYGIDPKLVRLIDRVIVNSHSKAISTKRFGTSSDVAAFFDGDEAVALGFTLGKEVIDAGNQRIGLSMGANFNYSTGHNAEDQAISSEYIRAKFFRQLNLVRFHADPKTVLSAETLQTLKRMNAASFGTAMEGKYEWTVPLELWGEANSNGKVGDPENGVAGGLYFGVYRFVPSNNFSTANTFLVLGFWGLVGMKLSEMKIATYSAFKFNENNVGDLASSCLGNLLISGDPMIEHRELSLRAPQNDPNLPSQLVKNSLGYFIVAANIDRRHEFPDFDTSGTLPKWLQDPDLPNGSELFKRFAGRVVFVDFKAKMIHYYTKNDGKLRVRIFNDAADLNNYDYVDLHTRAIELTRSKINEIIQAVEAAQSSENYEPIPGVKLEDLKIDWNRGLLQDEGMAEVAKTNTVAPSEIAVSVEMLRASYNSSRKLYNLANSYYHYFSFDRAVDLAKGYTFIGEDDDADMKELASRMAIPQLGVELHVARQTESNFPKVETAQAALEKARDALENPKLDLRFPGLGRYLNERGIAEFFKLKPHQVRATGMVDQLEKGVLDIDMGGGKTLISILLIIRRMERLKAEGVVPKALVVMPDALITNFYREVKKFTAKDPNNKAASARLNVVTLRNANIRMRYYTPQEEVVEKLKDAPDNTLILSSYSYLGGSRNCVKIYTGETQQKVNGETYHKAEYMFPVVEDLINKVGVNIVFLDESHKIKNNYQDGSYSHKACMALSRVKNKFIMTGTFVSRTPQDMFNQVKFIDPTMLGSIADFKKRYTFNGGKDWNHDKLKELRAYIQRRGVITMRREEWLYQLPPKDERFHFVNFKEQTPVIYKIYETLWDATAEEFPAEFTEALGGRINNDSDNDETNGLEDLESTETVEDEEREILKLQEASSNLANRMKSTTVCGRLMALRALVSAPERFPVFTEAMKTVQKRMSFNLDELLKGPKDDVVLSLVRKHFESLHGNYVPVSDQVGKADEKIGKIVIMSDRALIAQHMVRILHEAGYSDQDVVYYDASHREHLEAFCDPEARYPAIICAVENSIKEGVNMQSASRVIRLTIPWTTGDYDQSIARAFRTGQTKPVIVDNVICEQSFEPAMIARLVTRENINKKVTSDFDSNEYVEELTINPKTAGPNGVISNERDLHNYEYGGNGSRVDLLGLHDRIYQYEVKMSHVWRASYLLRLVDIKEQMDRDPTKYVWKELDRRAEIVYEGIDFIVERVPSFVTRDQNPSLENQIIFVNATKKTGWMYVVDEKRADSLKAVKLSFYELENVNERHEDRDVCGSNKLYEPWVTAGIRPEEMAVPMSDHVTEAEMENSAERQLRGIGQTDFETTLRQKIVRGLRAAADQGLDPLLSSFLGRTPLSIDNKLVTAVYDALTIGTYHTVFSKSPAVAAVYSAMTGVKYNRKDKVGRLQLLFKRVAEQHVAKRDAINQSKTSKPAQVALPSEPGPNERTLGGPAKHDPEQVEDLTKLQVALGDQNGIITLVVPTTLKNPSWKKMRLIAGYKTMKNAMFFPVTAESQIAGIFKRVSHAGGEVTNVEEFDTLEFRKVLRVLKQLDKPDQTATVSVYNMVTAANPVAIDLAWITMDRRLLIVALDVTPRIKTVLSDAGFRLMQPYLWKEVNQKGIAREVNRLSQRCALRNPITLGSRVLKLLKVRLPDRVLGLEN
jgi:SNF2 family DNA or RNA helicase